VNWRSVLNAIVDASALIAAYLPEEEYDQEARALVTAHHEKRLRLRAPWLLRYEVTNAVLVAVRQGRIAYEFAERVMEDVQKLHIGCFRADTLLTLALGHEHGRSAYDAAYLALAQQQGLPLITADRRLHNAVADKLPWVVWIGEWQQHIALGQRGAARPDLVEPE